MSKPARGHLDYSRSASRHRPDRHKNTAVFTSLTYTIFPGDYVTLSLTQVFDQKGNNLH